jgi:hypothetical protein
MSATPMKRLRAPTPFFANPTLIVTVTLAAFLAVGISGRGKMWPHGSNPPRQASSEPNDPALLPAPAAPIAPVPSAAPAEAAPIEPPARMTLAQQADFEAWLVKTYLGCWKPAPQAADADPYVVQVRLAYKPDGSLSKPPKLVNPPSDPALKPQAKSVMAAIQNCNPLPVPAQYRPFYEQWKTKTIHFDPHIAAR